MRDLHIQASTLKRELRIYVSMFILAILSNVYAIVTYDAPWIELLTQLHVIVILSVVFYAFSWLLRGMFLAMKAIFVRR